MVRSAVSHAIYLAGLPESHLENICLENVTAMGPKGMRAYNVDGLHMENVNIITPDEDKCRFENVKNL